ncbi:phage shock protein C (PspC) family protein [Haloactinospora alba]|uniref:Phage shock protein C (PspC) family protein n=1 Tax=Haloactinospora alba TaxID=405555 RepID=A0A543NMB7_9ACTN|nr:PspC domain-containing protein [Haloactinospora alba]TQN32971.1 phage shock protein C (PspC) family protein [Haloactinospora alba]
MADAEQHEPAGPDPAGSGGGTGELRKDSSSRVLAGVCSGLGHYTRIDPLVWRTGFVLITVGGTGVWLYLAAWALMRDSRGGPALLEQLFNRRFEPRVVLLLLTTGLAVSTLFSTLGGLSWRTLVLAVPLVLGVLSARNRGVDVWEEFRRLPSLLRSSAPPPTAPEPEPQPTYYNPAQPWATTPQGPVDLAAVSEHYAEGADASGTPEGASPPPPPPPSGREAGSGRTGRAPHPNGARRRRRRGAPLALFVLGVAVLAAGGTAAFDGGSALVSPRPGVVYLGGVVALTGLALVVGSWAGNPRGLVTLGTVASVLLVGVASVDMANTRIGRQEWRPASVEEATQAEYALTAGRAELDLTGLDPDPGQRVEVSARVNVGGMSVRVPRTARVVVRGTATVGAIRVGDTEHAGTLLRANETLPAADRRQAEGDPPTLALDLASHGGDMEVRRADS